MDKLAIVIPAYKSRFFHQTLESIANQTCKDFTLYIGDDASPEDIKSFVDPFRNKIPIIYKRFDYNLGGKDLVAQWERCVALAGNEEWIWLFSDDDVMSDKCVEGFYEVLAKYEKEVINEKVLRFNLCVTDTDLTVLQEYNTPSEFSVEYFLENYFIYHKLRNKAVEFIFSKKWYNKNDRFVNFPLAWGSDTATMLKFGQYSGFVTIEKGNIFWRASEYNVSSGTDIDINEQKQYITTLFLKWIISFIKVYKGTRFHNKLIYSILHFFPSLPSLNNIKEIYSDKDKLYFQMLLWIVFIKAKRTLRVHKIKFIFQRPFR